MTEGRGPKRDSGRKAHGHAACKKASAVEIPEKEVRGVLDDFVTVIGRNPREKSISLPAVVVIQHGGDR